MVRLTHLHLEKIRSYRTATIEFRDGVNAIVGHNGAGKSTILQAVGYALFNSLGGRRLDFVREGSTSGSIAVGLAEGREGASFEVVRELKKSGSADWYVIDLMRDIEVCRGRQDVQFFVQDLCNTRIDPGRLYTGIIGIQQGAFADPFRGTPGDRQRHFSPLLEVEKYKEAYDRLGRSEGPRGLIRCNTATLATDIARLEVRLEHRNHREAEQRTLILKLARVEAEEEHARKRLVRLAKASRKFDQLKCNLEAAEDKHAKACVELEAGRQQLRNADEELRQSTDALKIVEVNQTQHDRHLKTRELLEALAEDLKAMRDLARQKDRLDVRLDGYREQLTQGRNQLEHLDQLAVQQAGLADSARRYQALDQERTALEHRVGSMKDLHDTKSSAHDQAVRRQSRVDQLTSDLELRQQTADRAETLESRRDELATLTVRLEQQMQLANQQLERVNRQLAMLEVPAGDRATTSSHLCPLCNQPIGDEVWLELVTESEAEQQELQGRTSRLAKELDTSRQDAGLVAGEIEQLQSVLAGLPDEAALQQAISDLTLARQELDRVETQIQEDQELEYKLQATVADLTTLEDNWAAFKDHQRQLDGRGNIETVMAELEVEIAALETETASLETSLAPFAGVETKETTLTQTLNATRRAYETVLQHQGTAAQKPVRGQRHRELNQQVGDQEARLAEAVTDLNRCRDAYNHDAHVEHQADMRRLELDARERQTRLEEARLQLDALNKQLEEMKLLDAELVDKRTEKAAWDRRDSDLEDMRLAIRDMQPLMTRILNQRISRGANIIHQELTNSAAAELTWDETFAITLRVLGRERAFSQLSGGEQMTAALAVNLAMLQELSTVGFAFFDEPTTNLDEDRRTELATRLNTTRQVSQLIVISHDDTFEARVDHVIRVAKTGNESEIQTQDA